MFIFSGNEQRYGREEVQFIDLEREEFNQINQICSWKGEGIANDVIEDGRFNMLIMYFIQVSDFSILWQRCYGCYSCGFLFRVLEFVILFVDNAV